MVIMMTGTYPELCCRRMKRSNAERIISADLSYTPTYRTARNKLPFLLRQVLIMSTYPPQSYLCHLWLLRKKIKVLLSAISQRYVQRSVVSKGNVDVWEKKETKQSMESRNGVEVRRMNGARE
jgi:hypothetical protein